MSEIANQKILVIHGPNMNLLGLRKPGKEAGITLDKLNRHLRKVSIERGLSLSIFQTNDESRAVNRLQKQRKKIKGILLFPGPWQQSGHVIKDSLDIISIPYITVSIGEKVEILRGARNIEDPNIYKSAERALIELEGLISKNNL